LADDANREQPLLVIDAAHLEQICAQVAAAYPHEGCGLLLGAWSLTTTVVETIVPAENSWPVIEERTQRYEIAPDVIARADRDATRSGCDIVGIYHSHPDHSAEPSQYDLGAAWPDLSYLIISVRKQVVSSILSYRITGNASAFVLERLSIKNNKKLQAHLRDLV
jgi:proteasome lid subunit RPN8/RPN11